MSNKTADEWTDEESEVEQGSAVASEAGDGGEPVAGATDDMPPIPDEIREAGRLAPDHWLGMVDPTWKGEGEPPEWAMVGRWRSGLNGEIEEWQDNPEYKPSPRALGWPDPEDEVDEAIQLAATGYGPGEAVTEALVDRQVAVLVAPGGGPLVATTPNGDAAVPVFTSPVYLHTAGRLAFELVDVQELVGRIEAGNLLYLNPSGPVSMTLELDVLREAVDQAANPAAAATPMVTVSADQQPQPSVTAAMVDLDLDRASATTEER
ncbi:type VII secretion system-associated protein [Streptomyces sp. NBC_01233]|uniref:type VII secretion system-associated protein n=1 Tax=Streptomyces sp. NBC_01233 TaxID=2903787 RepID=UPI002E13C243|nr:type VII secretion system-associated protein [Streptomyces sp. NBC_01233]